jgi:hypothetical protein
VQPLAEKRAARKEAVAKVKAVKEGRAAKAVEAVVKERARAVKAAVVRVRAARKEEATDRRRQSLSPRSCLTRSTFQA